jgi:hypothetical protein
VAVTISLYNHTRKLVLEGGVDAGDTYKLMLCTSATFDATNTTLAGITKTETTAANGYTAGGASLSGVAVTTVSTSGAKFDANDASWSASGGDITASYAILYNDTDANDPPLAFIDFGASKTANDSTEFKVIWNANGIFTLS